MPYGPIHCRRCGRPGHQAKTCDADPMPFANQRDGWAIAWARCPLCGALAGIPCQSTHPFHQPRARTRPHRVRIARAREIESARRVALEREPLAS